MKVNLKGWEKKRDTVYISKLDFFYSFVQALKGPLYASFSRSIKMFFFFGGGFRVDVENKAHGRAQ